MGMFHHHNEESKNAYEAFYEGGDQPHHKAKFSHEAVSGAAAFFAMHEYEKKQKAEGKEVNHAFMKEAVAGIAAAEVDRLAETKGLDYLDREKSKRHAKEQAERMVDSRFS